MDGAFRPCLQLLAAGKFLPFPRVSLCLAGYFRGFYFTKTQTLRYSSVYVLSSTKMERKHLIYFLNTDQVLLGSSWDIVNSRTSRQWPN